MGLPDTTAAVGQDGRSGGGAARLQVRTAATAAAASAARIGQRSTCSKRSGTTPARGTSTLVGELTVRLVGDLAGRSDLGEVWTDRTDRAEPHHAMRAVRRDEIAESRVGHEELADLAQPCVLVDIQIKRSCL